MIQRPEAHPGEPATPPDPLARAKNTIRTARWPAAGLVLLLILLGIAFRHTEQWGDIATWVLATTTLLAFLAAAFAGIVAYDLLKIETTRDEQAAQERSLAAAERKRVLDERAALVTLGTLTSGERAELRAEEAYRDLAPALDRESDILIGRLMVALDQIQDVLTPGADETSGDRVSLLRAVTDWWRVGMPGLLTRDVLAAVYEDYRRTAAGLDPGVAVSTLGFDRALTWATSEASRGRPQLIDIQAVTRGVQFVPHPLLAVVADDQETGWTVADALWTYAERTARESARIRIGYTALDYQAFAHARNLLGPFLPAQVSPPALLAIAKWLAVDDVQAAHSWYAKVIATGDAATAPQAMFGLGRLEAELGSLPEAARWYDKAIKTKDPEAAPKATNNLGLLEWGQGNVLEARRLWKQAIGTGHAEAASRAKVGLGVLERQRGNMLKARRLLGEAIDAGLPEVTANAMVHLGILEMQQGNLAAARQSWEQAISISIMPDAQKAQEFLSDMNRRRDEQQCAEQFIQYGWQVYADEEMMTSSPPDSGEK